LAGCQEIPELVSRPADHAVVRGAGDKPVGGAEDRVGLLRIERAEGRLRGVVAHQVVQAEALEIREHLEAVPLHEHEEA
jgi:hypothetical protein